MTHPAFSVTLAPGGNVQFRIYVDRQKMQFDYYDVTLSPDDAIQLGLDLANVSQMAKYYSMK